VNKTDYNNEKKLLSDLKKGEILSYNFLFDRYYNQLCIYVLKMSDDLAIAEDVVQEVMVTIWQKKAEIKVKSSLKNYLYKSAYHAFLHHIRKEKKNIDMLEELKWKSLLEVNNEIEENVFEERLKKINAAIEGLPPKCRHAFELSRFEKLKYKEIASVMEISPKTVEIHISKALSILKKTVYLVFTFFYFSN